MTQPSSVRILIIGGGAVGTSALWHLAKRGVQDLLLIDKAELTSGSTWHAAGNCPNFSTSWSMMQLQRYSTQLYARLAEETGQPLSYHVTGSIRLAHRPQRMDEFAHVVAMAGAQGLEFARLTPAELQERYPFLTLDGLLGGLWDPWDGDIDPSQLTQAFAAGARAMGARILRHTPLLGLEQQGDGSWIATTDKGRIAAEVIVNAAGYGAAEVMALIGHHLPLVVLEHQYLVSEGIAALQNRNEKLPLLRDPDVSYYLRQERDGLLLGPYEATPRAQWLEGQPADFANQLFPDDLDRLEPYIAAAMERVPILGEVGIKRVINGPIPYSPDGNPYIGPAPGLRNFFHCNCFSFGITQAGGAGKTLADWVLDGEPEWDLWSLDPRRYTAHATQDYTRDRALELYAQEYGIAFPVEERPAGRPAKTSPLYPLLQAEGGFFTARNGWERVAYFPLPDQPALQRLSFRRAETAWFEAVRQECLAVAERAGLFEIPGFSRFHLTGPGTAGFVDRLICGRLPRVGRLGLSWILSEKGGVWSEVTVTRLAEDEILLMSAASAEWHDQDLLMQSLPADGSVRLRNVTDATTVLLLTGPKTREILQPLTATDLSSRSFPWLSHQPMQVAGIACHGMRVSYVGELGWELHVPMADAVALWQALRQAGAPHGLRLCGMYAMDSLRLEKAYRGWKSDLIQQFSPLAAGFERMIDWDKPEFRGRQALLQERQALAAPPGEAGGGTPMRCVPLILDQAGPADAPVCAPVWSNGSRVGLALSGGYGHRLERSLALAYVEHAHAIPGTALQIEILGEKHAAVVALDPPYDPENQRLRA